MKRFFENETITGIANTEVLGNGVTSTEGEIKTLKAIIFAVSARQSNEVRLWKEREMIFAEIDQISQIPADVLRRRIEFDHEIAVGQTIKGAVNCGANLTSVYIQYEYEIDGEN